MKVSIVIRARNEERWISSCLHAVFNQDFRDFEVILVDNASTDQTVFKAKQFGVKIINMKDKYFPGKALNTGVRASCGEFLVSLSAHCIPKNKYWLSNLLRNFDAHQEIAGVYGRQEPMSQTTDLDKRDLWIIFGLDRRIQTKDSFFHNANSMIRRSVWEKVPFDEKVTNIEDRIWAKQIIDKGFKIIYEPDASVYHYHGIHQSADTQRCKNIVKIMESIEKISDEEENLIKDLNITAIVPMKGEVEYLKKRPLLKYTVEHAKESRFINSIIVSTDNPKIAEIANKSGAEAPFLRPAYLSQPEVGIESVLKFSLQKLEKQGRFSDLIVYLGAHMPFRPQGIIDNLIKLLFHNGFESVLPGKSTFKSCWRQEENNFQRIDEGFFARKVKKPIRIGYPALTCVTYPEFIRQGRLLGNKVGIYEISDVFSTFEIIDKRSRILAEEIFSYWRSNEIGNKIKNK